MLSSRCIIVHFKLALFVVFLINSLIVNYIRCLKCVCFCLILNVYIGENSWGKSYGAKVLGEKLQREKSYGKSQGEKCLGDGEVQLEVLDS